MRSLLLAGVAAAVAIAGPAVAADMTAAPFYKAPPAPVVMPVNWTGFYLGGHIGAGWGTKETFSTAFDDPVFAGKAAGTSSVAGFLGGFQAGLNYQVSWVVIGIDGDISFADVSGTRIDDGEFVEGGVGVKSSWFATLTGRIGGTVDHALLYLKGGIAWTNDSFSLDCGGACTAISTPDLSRTGWTVGAGIEYAFTRNWSGKLEYDYMDFGTATTGTFRCGSDGPCDRAFNFDLRQRVSAVKAGVNYKFDWGSTVAARY